MSLEITDHRSEFTVRKLLHLVSGGLRGWALTMSLMVLAHYNRQQIFTINHKNAITLKYLKYCITLLNTDHEQ
jgi:hypothetical protein